MSSQVDYDSSSEDDASILSAVLKVRYLFYFLFKYCTDFSFVRTGN